MTLTTFRNPISTSVDIAQLISSLLGKATTAVIMSKMMTHPALGKINPQRLEIIAGALLKPRADSTIRSPMTHPNQKRKDLRTPEVIANGKVVTDTERIVPV